ncbi:MAG: hypothetical protein ABI910_08195 [Gemmatimonadota bacterium]
MLTRTDVATDRWILQYKDARQDFLSTNAEFARWLEEEYVPIAGGWMY